MHAFPGEIYLTSALWFSVFVVLSVTENKAACGMSGLQKWCCLVAFNVCLPGLIPV